MSTVLDRDRGLSIYGGDTERYYRLLNESIAAMGAPILKFNENHDPKSGEFAAGHSGSAGPRAEPSRTSRPTRVPEKGTGPLVSSLAGRKFIERDLQAEDHHAPTSPNDPAHSMSNEIVRSNLKASVQKITAERALKDSAAHTAADAWRAENAIDSASMTRRGLPGVTPPRPLTDGEVYERVADGMMGDWSSTSGDSFAPAVATQLAAVKALGLPQESADAISERYEAQSGRFDRLRSPGEPTGMELLARAQKSDGGTREIVIKAMYDQTQEQLAAAGIKEITLYRGLTFSEAEVGGLPEFMRKGGEGEAVSQPLSSWSADRSVAHSFANFSYTDTGEKGVHGVILAATFPAERIVATPRTGMGALSEYEFLTASGDGKVQAEEILPPKPIPGEE